MLKWLGIVGAGLVLGCGKANDQEVLGGPSVGGAHVAGAGTPSAGAAGAEAAVGGEASDYPPGEHRLKHWQLETDGTSPLMLGITDPEHNVHCVFLHDSEGTLRCLPQPVDLAESRDADGKPLHPDCPTPVFIMERPAAEALAGKLISRALPRPTCEPQRYATHVVKLASDLGNTPECFAPNNPDDGWLELTITPALPDDTWQSGTEIDGPALVGGRLRIKQFESADGARFFSRIVDEGLGGGTCSLTPYTLTPCLPPHTKPWYFSDEHCQQPLGRAPTCETPVYAETLTMKLALGKEYVGSVWNQPHGGCYAWSSLPDTPPARFFELGEALPPEFFGELHWQFSGQGRVEQNGLLGEDGAIHFVDAAFKERPPYRDGRTNKECYPTIAPDGVRYCLPEDIPDINAYPANPDAKLLGPYVDAACTTLAYACFGDCTTAKMSEARSGVARSATAVYALHELPTAYHFDGANCTEVPPDGVTRYFEIESERPWTDWPALREANALRP